MNSFDLGIMHWLNQFAHHSVSFDKMMFFLANCFMLKGGVVMTIFWWLWFKEGNTYSENRKRIVFTFIGCIAAMVVARMLAIVSPMRPRPLHETALQFVVPYGLSADDLDGWSSFPSDHAALFFSLSAGLYFVSKRVSILTTIYTILIIAIPRMYLGYHYPTDILSGAFIGILLAAMANIYLIRWERLVTFTHWFYSKPSLFYSLFFLFSYQIADMFNNTRDILGVGVKLLKSLF